MLFCALYTLQSLTKISSLGLLFQYFSIICIMQITIISPLIEKVFPSHFCNPYGLILSESQGSGHTRFTTWHTVQDPRCRLCKQHAETVAHIISGCSKLAGIEYTKRHNNVASLVYRAICAEYNLEHSKDW